MRVVCTDQGRGLATTLKRRKEYNKRIDETEMKTFQKCLFVLQNQRVSGLKDNRHGCKIFREETFIACHLKSCEILFPTLDT